MSRINGRRRGPAYKVHTRRLMLRCFEPRDAALYKAAVDENIEHLYPWMSWTRREPECLDDKIQRMRQLRANFDADKDFVYGIFNVGETLILGAGGLHTRVGPGAREIGYWIHKSNVNKGFATEVTAALIRVAFEIDEVLRIEIHVDPRNHSSAKVPEKLGFVYEGTLQRRGFLADGSPRDEMIWTLFASDYPESEAAKYPVRAYDAVGRRLI